MSLETRHNAIVISSGLLLSGALTKTDEEPSLTNEGWDGLKVTYYQMRASCTAEQCAALFPIGAQLGTRKWWITGATPTQVTAGFWRFVVDFKGWASNKPAVVRVGSSANQQSGSNILAPTAPGDNVGAYFAKVETHENMPDLTVSYLTDNITATGVTGQVGKAKTPPVAIAVPATVWSFLTSYVYHWPNGWVLMGSAQDRLPGTDAAAVTDTYKFIREITPG